MTTLDYINPELLIAVNKKVIFVNPSDLQIFNEFELPEDLTKCGLSVQSDNGEAATTSEPKEKEENSKNQLEPLSIVHVKLSPDHQLVAVTTSGQKAVLLYRYHIVQTTLLSIRHLARASSAITFASDSLSLLVTDKTGDCYQYDCVDLQAPPKLLLGHLSIVYDLIWSSDMKYIITCDRDDKIRVTNYPKTYDIHGYCLGHKEFVAGMALLGDNVLASVSGDKTIRLWNFLSGQQLAVKELPAPALHLTVRAIEDGKFQAAVLLYQPNESVGIYEISKNAQEVWQVEQIEIKSFPNMIVNTFCFVNQQLYVAGIDSERFSLKVSPAEGVPENWLEMVEEQFKNDTLKPIDVSAWFKKRYDNVSDYLERKKRRIEEKEKK